MARKKAITEPLRSLLARLTTVEPPKEYADAAAHARGRGNPPYFGYCFWLAFKFVHSLVLADHRYGTAISQRSGTWLVHGKCRLGGFGEHAWVELPGGVCFDGVHHRFCTRRSYYRVLACRPFQKYSAQAAMLVMEHVIRSEPDVYDASIGCEDERPEFILCHLFRAAERLPFTWFDVLRLPWDPPLCRAVRLAVRT